MMEKKKLENLENVHLPKFNLEWSDCDRTCGFGTQFLIPQHHLNKLKQNPNLEGEGCPLN